MAGPSSDQRVDISSSRLRMAAVKRHGYPVRTESKNKSKHNMKQFFTRELLQCQTYNPTGREIDAHYDEATTVSKYRYT